VSAVGTSIPSTLRLADASLAHDAFRRRCHMGSGYWASWARLQERYISEPRQAERV
jgi:hypothetical protein